MLKILSKACDKLKTSPQREYRESPDERNIRSPNPSEGGRAQGISTKALYAARAQNAELWDVDGKRYIDFAAGIAVLNTGHRHPSRDGGGSGSRRKAFTHTCFHVAPYESYMRLAERLNALVAGRSSPRRRCSSPPVPRRWRTRSRSPAPPPAAPPSIAFSGGFHGRTHDGAWR